MGAPEKELIASLKQATPAILTREEKAAVAFSKDAAARGEFATDEQVQAVWSKHGL